MAAFQEIWGLQLPPSCHGSARGYRHACIDKKSCIGLVDIEYFGESPTGCSLITTFNLINKSELLRRLALGPFDYY